MGKRGSKKEEDRNEQAIGGLMKLPPNRRYINCDSSVFIFGSFTEDENRLFQKQPTQTDVPLENARLQFGSLEFASLSSSEGFGAETKQTDSSVRSNETQALKLVTEVETCKDGNAPITNGLQNLLGPQLNGSTNGCFSPNDEFLDSASLSSLEGFGAETKQTCSSVRSKDTQTSNLVTKDKMCQDGKTQITNDFQNISGDQLNGSTNGCFSLNDGVIKKEQDTLGEKAPFVKSLLPRGLINLGNLCFLNATLQALLSCSLFVQLLRDLRTENIPKVGYPTLHAFIEFISYFEIAHDSNSKKNERGVLETGKPFSPKMFDAVLKKFTPDLPNNLAGRLRQEDAQEFLSFLMDQMHDELLKLRGHLSSSNGGSLPLISSTEDDGWETVGPKNKSAVTRTQSFMSSELSAIFGGQLRSVVKARGIKASATVQPFLLLHLDIFPEAVHSIEDALHFFSAQETLEGYRTSAGKAGVVSASKSLKIQTPSKIMILHLMRFSYGSRGSTKLHKPIRFPQELVLGRELLVSQSSKGHKYVLEATITHHGREPSKGHYTADTRCSDGRWLRYDDATVVAVGINKVLHDQAYLLFYKQV